MEGNPYHRQETAVRVRVLDYRIVYISEWEYLYIYGRRAREYYPNCKRDCNISLTEQSGTVSPVRG